MKTGHFLAVPRQVFGLMGYLLLATSQLLCRNQCQVQGSFPIPLRGSPGLSPGSLLSAPVRRHTLEDWSITDADCENLTLTCTRPILTRSSASASTNCCVGGAMCATSKALASTRRRSTASLRPPCSPLRSVP